MQEILTTIFEAFGGKASRPPTVDEVKKQERGELSPRAFDESFG